MKQGATANRLAPKPSRTECERLCAYLKNDSVVRWYLGCTQAEIDAARANLARERQPSNLSVPASAEGLDPCSEERWRRRRAIQANRKYLTAICRKHG